MSAVPAIVEIRQDLEKLKPQIEMVLPAHITPDKFMRVALTAIQQSPDLLRADRRSLFASTMKCAQDGLLPDGREAAFVTFNTKDGKKVQYMPMVVGILKKVRNSGELLSIVANVVYEKDTFRYWVDDAGEHVTHEPNVLEADRGKLIAVYAIAKTKDGGVYTEVMSRSQIEQVRAVSKAKDNGPWVGWYDEMARKTVIRRLSKRLPMSTDLEQVIRRDDELYQPSLANAPRSGVDAAKALLGLAAPAFDAETGEITETDGASDEGNAGADYIPQFETEAAVGMLKSCKSLSALEKAWKLVADDYSKSSRELPAEVDAAYKDRKEALKQEASKL